MNREELRNIAEKEISRAIYIIESKGGGPPKQLRFTKRYTEWLEDKILMDGKQ
jgi:hypothetical protein